MTASVTPRYWNILLIALAGMLVFGFALAAILARGAADPPRDNLITLELTPNGTARAPFTLETTGTGFTLRCGDAPPLMFRVRLNGYFSVSESDPVWVGFHHITRERNTLYLHVNADGMLMFRINSEIAWTANTQPANTQPTNPQPANTQTASPECTFSRLTTP